MRQPRPDYYLITSRSGDYPNGWCWEIKRRSQPMGIKLMACGFKSDGAAWVAGKKALSDFLGQLAEEDVRAL